ncbi:MAG: plastocyanin/azurin family copper-binding protein [bacterium]
MKKGTFFLLSGASLALLLVAAGCYKSASTNVNTAVANITSNTNTNRVANENTNATAASVTISGLTFAPSPLTVKKGTTVVWTNNDATSHTVTEEDGGQASGTINSGGTYSLTFTTTGTFRYHCSIHPSMMGTVTVTE